MIRSDDVLRRGRGGERGARRDLTEMSEGGKMQDSHKHVTILSFRCIFSHLKTNMYIYPESMILIGLTLPFLRSKVHLESAFKI